MKKIIYMMILFAAVMTGCEEDSYRTLSDSQVEIEKSNVTFTAKGGTGTIEVSASALPVTATSDQSWCSVSVSGNIITVTAGENVSMLGRTALITVQSGNKINYVPVSQASLYLHLDNYETVVFLGNGGTVSIPYECDVQSVPVRVTTEAPWLSADVSANTIILTAQTNPDFLNARNTNIEVVAGDRLVSIPLTVVQGELITSYEPDPNVNTVDAFLNLKNNNGSSSRYKITYFSSVMDTYVKGIQAAYPAFLLQEMRIEAPRSSYQISVVLYNVDGSQASGYSSYYWNATNGLVPVNGSKSVAAFVFSGNSYSGTTAPYTGNANYTSLRAIFASADGFTVIPDGDFFWFRSVANPMNYFKVEPASW
jgi:hypothetical protein